MSERQKYTIKNLRLENNRLRNDLAKMRLAAANVVLAWMEHGAGTVGQDTVGTAIATLNTVCLEVIHGRPSDRSADSEAPPSDLGP